MSRVAAGRERKLFDYIVLPLPRWGRRWWDTVDTMDGATVGHVVPVHPGMARGRVRR